MTTEEKLAKSLLASDAYWTVNKALAREIGVNAAFLLADLISKQGYFEDRGLTDEDGFWYQSQANIEADLGLSPHQQRKALKKLEKLKILKRKIKGLPALSHYRIDFAQLLKNLTTSCKKSKELVVKKFNTNKNKYNNNILSDKEKKKPKTISERRDEFRQLCKQHISAKKGYTELMMKDFFEYWTERGDNDKKMRFEKEKTFGITRRLATWKRNEPAFKPKAKINKL